MSEFLFALGVGLVFALGGLACFGILIGIGEMIAWYERKQK